MPMFHEKDLQMLPRLCAAIMARVVRFSAGLMKVSTSGERFIVETALFGTSA
jgi:hypothetical protein